MYPILINGYRPQYDEGKLREFIKHSKSIQPMARSAAIDLLDGLTIDEMMEKYDQGKGYTLTLRSRAKLVLKVALASNPEGFGLEKIEPVTEGMSTTMLAEHCGVSNQIILSRVRRSQKLALPMPELIGKAWWFSKETANLYIQNLGV